MASLCWPLKTNYWYARVEQAAFEGLVVRDRVRRVRMARQLQDRVVRVVRVGGDGLAAVGKVQADARCSGLLPVSVGDLFEFGDDRFWGKPVPGPH